MAGDWADDVHNDISLDLHFHRYCSFAWHFTKRFWRLDRWTNTRRIYARYNCIRPIANR